MRRLHATSGQPQGNPASLQACKPCAHGYYVIVKVRRMAPAAAGESAMLLPATTLHRQILIRPSDQTVLTSCLTIEKHGEIQCHAFYSHEKKEEEKKRDGRAVVCTSAITRASILYFGVERSLSFVMYSPNNPGAREARRLSGHHRRKRNVFCDRGADPSAVVVRAAAHGLLTRSLFYYRIPSGAS
ncbi:hypothetical protein F4861DRAFT_7656 [Xylaria intraflava]|nr:hypothetical protein F4861DRAFT_7656 [Xylaria intraflava]